MSAVHPLRGAIQRARAEGRAALVVYVMAGDPSLEETVRLVPRLAQAGADVVELGFPFSDPIADGGVLQLAAQRSLAAGTSLARILDAAREISRECPQTPLVLMGYANPLFAYGEARFARDAARAGVAGAIVADLPASEAGGLAAVLRGEGLALVPLVAPTTRDARIAEIARLADGFVYYVSVTGVTGARVELPPELTGRLDAARRAAAPAPLAVGFGIGTPEQARPIAPHEDAVVVGSALVRTLAGEGVEAGLELVRRLREALEGSHHGGSAAPLRAPSVS